MNLLEYLADPELSLPDPIDLEEAAGEVAALHERDGGCTLNLYFGGLAGQRLFAVSLYPERTVYLSGHNVPEQVLRAFIRQNRELLSDPRNSVGTWYNPDEDQTYLDVTATLPDRRQAVTMGERYNQEAIYDLGRGELIELRVTGKPAADVPAEGKRLPPLQRGRKRT